jgi:hypothetical protein
MERTVGTAMGENCSFRARVFVVEMAFLEAIEGVWRWE